MGHPGWAPKRAALPRKRDIGIADDVSAPVSTEETFRRLTDPVAAATPAAVVASGGGSAAPAKAAAAVPVPPAAPTVIDRLHKESGNPDGMYITVMLPHMASETDQTPPLNAAYSTSINAAYVKAMASLPLLNPTARITIKIMAGIYYEHVVVTNPRIDFEGWDRATIAGQVTVQAFALIPGQISTQFTNLDFISLVGGKSSAPNPMGALFLMPNGDVNPQFESIQIHNCRFYSDSVAMFAQQRFYAEKCHWYRTGGQLSDDYLQFNETDIPLVITLTGAELGATVITLSSIHARERSQAPWSSIGYGFQPLNRVPLGYAWAVHGGSQGPTNIHGTSMSTGDSVFVNPISCVEISHSSVFGSLLHDQSNVEHSFCDVHAGVPALNPTSTT